MKHFLFSSSSTPLFREKREIFMDRETPGDVADKNKPSPEETSAPEALLPADNEDAEASVEQRSEEASEEAETQKQSLKDNLLSQSTVTMENIKMGMNSQAEISMDQLNEMSENAQKSLDGEMNETGLKENQRMMREFSKLDQTLDRGNPPAGEWGPIENGKNFGNKEYVYRTVERDGKQVLQAFAPGAKLQEMGPDGKWKPAAEGTNDGGAVAAYESATEDLSSKDRQRYAQNTALEEGFLKRGGEVAWKDFKAQSGDLFEDGTAANTAVGERFDMLQAADTSDFQLVLKDLSDVAAQVDEPAEAPDLDIDELAEAPDPDIDEPNEEEPGADDLDDLTDQINETIDKIRNLESIQEVIAMVKKLVDQMQAFIAGLPDRGAEGEGEGEPEGEGEGEPEGEGEGEPEGEGEGEPEGEGEGEPEDTESSEEIDEEVDEETKLREKLGPLADIRDTLQDRITETGDKIAQNADDIGDIEGRIGELKGEEQELADAKSAREALDSAEPSASDTDIQLADNRVLELEIEVESNQDELAQLKESMATLQSENESLQTGLDAMEKVLDTFDALVQKIDELFEAALDTLGISPDDASYKFVEIEGDGGEKSFSLEIMLPGEDGPITVEDFQQRVKDAEASAEDEGEEGPEDEGEEGPEDIESDSEELREQLDQAKDKAKKSLQKIKNAMKKFKKNPSDGNKKAVLKTYKGAIGAHLDLVGVMIYQQIDSTDEYAEEAGLDDAVTVAQKAIERMRNASKNLKKEEA